jgi:hypothetical protein
LAGPLGGAEHVPRAALGALFVQMPLQHCVPVAHASPCWPHHDDALQTPPEQSAEQHSAPLVHAFPSVLHAVLRGAHVPPLQVPLQQDAPELHAA